MKWHDLGIELLDCSDVGELDIIEAEHPSDLNKCCTKMFNLWLKKQPEASWNQLMEALRQPGIELGTSASKIEQMLLQPKPQGWLFTLYSNKVICMHAHAQRCIMLRT